MHFPYHDRFWTSTVEFLKRHYRPGQEILGPEEFIDEFPSVHSYAASFCLPPTAYSWVALHKGKLDEVKYDFLQSLPRHGVPVFANEVFVLFSCSAEMPRLSADSPHLRAYEERLAKNHHERQPSAEQISASFRPRISLAHMSVQEIRAEMNRRYSRTTDDDFGGYEHPHLWDKVRFREIDRIFGEFIAGADGKKVLEFACGLGRNVFLVENCAEYTGIDLSDVAIERDCKRFADRPRFRFHAMDCAHLEFPSERFDVVMAIEMIEHVHDAEKVIAEAHRVLKPGGRLFIDSANRDSLHLRMMRKLGHPEFRATFEHIREFSFVEMKEMVERIGFVVEQSRGVFLLPYFGIPEIDGPVRHLTDDDPEVVEMMRELGERAGPEYGFEFVIAARKNR